MFETFKAPHNLPEFVDPLKEFFTWKWVTVVIITFCSLFSEFVLFCLSIITTQFLFAFLLVIGFGITLGLFLNYAMTPQKLEENCSRIIYSRGIRHGINTFSKWSPTVKKWVVANFTGFIEIDEETGLCKEKPNSEMY